MSAMFRSHVDAVAVFDVVGRSWVIFVLGVRRRTCNDKDKTIQGSFASLEDDEGRVVARSRAAEVERKVGGWLA